MEIVRRHPPPEKWPTQTTTAKHERDEIPGQGTDAIYSPRHRLADDTDVESYVEECTQIYVSNVLGTCRVTITNHRIDYTSAGVNHHSVISTPSTNEVDYYITPIKSSVVEEEKNNSTKIQMVFTLRFLVFVVFAGTNLIAQCRSTEHLRRTFNTDSNIRNECVS